MHKEMTLCNNNVSENTCALLMIPWPRLVGESFLNSYESLGTCLSMQAERLIYADASESDTLM